MRHATFRSAAPARAGDRAVPPGVAATAWSLAAIVATALLALASPAHATSKAAHAAATASPSTAATAAQPARISPYLVWRRQHDEAQRAAGAHTDQRAQGQSKARRLPN